MKQTIIIIASILFSSLFFQQNIGLNLSLFSVLTIIVLGIFHHQKMKTINSIVLIAVYLITAILVFINHSTLAIIANCATFFTLVGMVSENNASLYVQWLNGIYSSIAGVFHRNFEVDEAAEKVVWHRNFDVWHLVRLIVIPLIVVTAFIIMYKDGNPFFHDIISRINFEFINFQWLLFCVLGYFLFNNISQPVRVEPATDKDLATGNTLFRSGNLILESLFKEKQLGTLLLALLNGLIVLYIISDVAFLFSDYDIKASTLSEQVHNGVNALIASIVFAIIIILYFFRGNLNFIEQNKILKNLAYTWIFLNVILVFLICIKNNQYVSYFGLTYKRIGVYVYLLMTLAGLVTTFLKVFRTKNLWFLLRRNVVFGFSILILFSFVDWDYFITDYNIKYAYSLDVNYLIQLSHNNAIILHEKRNEMVLDSRQSGQIYEKYAHYTDYLRKSNWQEWTYDNFKIND